MKHFIISSASLLALAGGSALAQEVAPGDSVAESKELQEVVVVGANQTARAGELTFRPTDREKKVSANGYDLLRHMAMPQISVNPVADNVTTLTGSGVAMYINGMPASETELKNLRTKDVMRVDYLDYPSATNFQGASHVINFIVRYPELGGYTKLQTNQAITGSSALSNSSSVFSKLKYKKMSYDLYVGWDYINNHKIGDESITRMSLLTPDGESYWLEETSKTNYTRHRQWDLPISFRAVYSSQRFQAVNTAFFTYATTPASTVKGIRTYNNAVGMEYPFYESAQTSNRSVGWNYYYYLNLGKGFDMAFNGYVTYGNNHRDRIYHSTLSAEEAPVINNSREDAWDYSFNLTAGKSFSEAHSISANWFLRIQDFNIDYTGTNAFSTKMKNTNTGGSISYNGRFPFNLILKGSIGLAWYQSVTDGKSYTNIYPTLNIESSYSPSNHHQFNLEVNLSSNSSPASYKTNDVLQNYEFLYRTGNPDLEDYMSFRTMLNYVWIPDYKFYVSAYGQFSGRFDPVIIVYRHYKEGQALLKTYTNSGHFYSWNTGLSLTYRPLNHWQFNLSAAYQPYSMRGEVNCSIHPITAQLNATYYARNFFVTLYGSPATRTLKSTSHTITHGKPTYGLRAGWSNSNWNIQLTARNFFNRSWKGAWTEEINPLYEYTYTSLQGDNHSQFSLYVSYTFNYGKQVKRGDEIEGDRSIKSAVLY